MVAGAGFALGRQQWRVAMDHLIEFDVAFLADLEISPKHRLERLAVQKGMRARVGLRPYVVKSLFGPIEVADLYFADGGVTRQVRFAWFHFVE
jgi:hypothetical protein